MANVSELRFR